MRHIESFDRFLAEEVSLNPARRRRLNRSATAVTEFLSRNLHGYRSNERQGSYAQGTIIKPVDDGEYDADVLESWPETDRIMARGYTPGNQG